MCSAICGAACVSGFAAHRRPRAGHYISYVHVSGQWFCFDDGLVTGATQASVEAAFGASNEWVATHDTHAYLLFYERVGAASGAKSSDASVSGSADGGAPGERSAAAVAEAVAESAAADVRVRMRSRRHQTAAPAPAAAPA